MRYVLTSIAFATCLFMVGLTGGVGSASAQSLQSVPLPENAEALESFCQGQFPRDNGSADECYWAQYESVLRLGDMKSSLTYMQRRRLSGCLKEAKLDQGVDYVSLLDCFDSDKALRQTALGE